MPRDTVSYTWPWPPQRGPPAPTTITPARPFAQDAETHSTPSHMGRAVAGRGSGPGTHTRGVQVAGRDSNERKQHDMAKTPAEIELDHFRRGTGRYLDYGTSDESSEAATRIFLHENIVIPRSELPEISEEHGGVNAPAEYHLQIKAARASGRISAYGQRLVALLEVARAEYRKAQYDAEKEATASLMRRRDELAGEFTAVNSYNGQLPYTQNLINRIIELEGATK